MTATAPEAGASTPDDDARRDALAGRLFEALLGTFDLLSVQLGIELGLYAALRDRRPRDAAGARDPCRDRRPLRARVAGAAGGDRPARRRRRRRRRRRAPLHPARRPRGGRPRSGRPGDDDPSGAGDPQRGRGVAGAAHRLPHRGRRPLERVPAHLGGPGGGEPAAVPAPPRPGVAARHPRRRCPAPRGRRPRRRRRLRRRLVDASRSRVPTRRPRCTASTSTRRRSAGRGRRRATRGSRIGRGSTSSTRATTASTARSTS